jgi:hypothetical protein
LTAVQALSDNNNMNTKFKVGDEVLIDDTLYGAEYYGTVTEVIPNSLPGFGPTYEVKVPGLYAEVACAESYLRPYKLGLWDGPECECGAEKDTRPPYHHANFCPKKGQ